MDKNSLKDNIKGDQIFKNADGTLKSKYFQSAEKVIERLNSVSPSFCLAKWYNVSLHLTTGRTHSCYHPPSHSIPLEEIAENPAALHNTKYKKLQRKKMLSGERPGECSYCWKIEDSGSQFSDRAYRSADIFSEELLREALLLEDKGDPSPRYLEINFNQACNFKCTYCSPHLSTTWLREVTELGPIKLKNNYRHNDILGLQEANLMPKQEDSKKYVEAFWKWLPDVYPHLKFLRMTGGEPLIDINTFRVFDFIKKHPKGDLQIAITSNCCPPEELWVKFITSIKELGTNKRMDHFMLFCSLDSWGPQAEYIRTGMNFDQLQRNVEQFVAETEMTSVSFILTFNALSVVGLKKFMEGILNLRKSYSHHRQKIWFDLPILHGPEWMSLRILPKSYVKYLQDCRQFMLENLEAEHNRFKGFKDYEVSKLERVIEFLEKEDNNFNLKLAQQNFYLFFKQIDERRDVSFLKVFPEMGEFYHHCRHLESSTPEAEATALATDPT